MDLSVVIINWNAADDTIDCIGLVESWQQLECAVWVVDNGSAGGQADRIAAACPQAEVVAHPANLGFPGATNLALELALSRSKAPVLFLNNDATLSGDDAAMLLATLHGSPSTGVVGPVVLASGDPVRVLTAGNRSPVLHRDHAIRSVAGRQQPYPVVFVSGAAAVIRSEVFAAVGRLDERYFFGLEMADLCTRTARAGLETVVDPRARCVHHIDRASTYRETLYVYYVVRNRFLYIRTFHRAGAPVLMTAWAAYGVQQSLRLHLQGRRPTARAIGLGVRDGVVGVFGGQNRRVLSACGGGVS